jgi:TolB-like protein/lipopolysaccharide biosynthesis regulator YciM
MPESPDGPEKRSDPPPNEPRLESWGELASYLRRDIRTVQRWEHLHGLPVRRLMIGKQGQVYAYRSELDKWMRERQPKVEAEEPSSEQDHEQKRSPLSTPSISTEVLREPPPKSTFSSLQVWSGALIVIVLLTVVFFFPALKGIVRRLFHPAPSKVLLFVRPFENLSNDPDQQLFVKGLKDEMIIQLGKLDPAHLGVFAPTTSDVAGTKTIQELRSTLAADYVLEGSVRRANQELRIDVALISAEDQSQLWAKSYAGNAGLILQLQDNVTLDVAKEISAILPGFAGDVNPRGRRAVDPLVYDAYLEGRVHWLDRDIQRSMTAYQRALQIDPGYAPARAGLATSYLLLGETPNDALRPVEAIPPAREAAEQALKSDPKLADAYCVLANIAQSYDHNLPEAERLFKQAIAVDTSNVTAHEWYGYYLMVTSNLAGAARETNRALELDPASPLMNTVSAEVKYYQRNYDGAIRQATQSLQNHPNFLLARFWLASAYREKKMFPQAIEQFDIARKQSNNVPSMLMAYGHALGVSGDKAGALKVLQDLERMSQSHYVPALYFAGLYAGLGDLDQAFHWLDTAYQERNDRLVYLNVDPIADPLRSDPRFLDLMKRVGLH